MNNNDTKLETEEEEEKEGSGEMEMFSGVLSGACQDSAAGACKANPPGPRAQIFTPFILSRPCVS